MQSVRFPTEGSPSRLAGGAETSADRAEATGGCAGHFGLLLGGKAGLEDSDLQALELDSRLDVKRQREERKMTAEDDRMGE